MPCFCFLYNVVEQTVKDGGVYLTPYEKHFDEPFLRDDIIQFGCEVEYKPSNPDYIKLQHGLGT